MYRVAPLLYLQRELRPRVSINLDQILGLFQTDLQSIYERELFLYEQLPGLPGAYGEWPFYEFQLKYERWTEVLKEREKQRRKEQDKQRQQQGKGYSTRDAQQYLRQAKAYKPPKL